MLTKNWYQSKVVWLNIITAFVAVATALQGVALFDKYAPLLVLVNVVGNTLLRVYFTNTNISASTIPNV